MTHIIVFAEGYSEDFKKLEAVFHGKTYNDGKAKVRMREVKLYTCSVNENGRTNFLADLRELDRGGYDGRKDGQFFAWGKLVKWLIRTGRLFGLKKIVDVDLPEPSFKRYEDLLGSKAFRGHVIVLGEVPDPRVLKQGEYGHKGEEVV